MLFIFRSAAASQLRRLPLFVPGMLALTPAVVLLLSSARHPTSSMAAWGGPVATTMLVAWIVAQTIGFRSIGASGDSAALPSPALRSPRAELGAVAWTAAALSAAVVISTAWVGVDLALRSTAVTATRVVLTLAVAMGGAAGCTLVVWSLDAFLPRIAAVAASGAWLLLSCRAAGPVSWLAANLTFPVSPSLLATDESAHLGDTLRALGSIALFDLAWFVLLIAVGRRRPR